MLIALVERYISLRQTLGYKLRDLAASLRGFATFATNKSDTHVRTSTAVDWATGAPSQHARYIRLRNVVLLARFLSAEDSAHEVPPNSFHASTLRRLPYIYPQEEIAQLVGAASQLRESYPLRRQVYRTLLGLIAATGLRISEALDLRLDDILPDGVLQIRRTKFGKSAWFPCTPPWRMPLTGTSNSGDGWS
jgi:integrase/recombinase XerD